MQKTGAEGSVSVFNLMIERISPPGVPAPRGPYSPAVRAGDFIFVSGQAPVDPATQQMVTGDIRDETRQTLTNIIMMMDAALHRSVHEPEETAKLLRWIRKQAQTGLQETRSILYELRALKPARIRGLKSLKALVETFGRLSRIKTKV